MMLRNDFHDPASVDHDLLRKMILLDDDSYPSSCRGLYSAVGISEYDPTDRHNRYPVSEPSAYYLRLMSSDHHDQWIMGETESRKDTGSSEQYGAETSARNGGD